jgi:hypothetical protein
MVDVEVTCRLVEGYFKEEDANARRCLTQFAVRREVIMSGYVAAVCKFGQGSCCFGVTRTYI